MELSSIFFQREETDALVRVLKSSGTQSVDHDPLRGLLQNVTKYIFTLQLIKVPKLQLRHNNENNFMAGGHHNVGNYINGSQH